MSTDMEPVLKWAGGKRQLIDKIIQRMPLDFANYYEPFIGGGAVLFGISELLKDKEIVINDINTQLINLYNVIKDEPLIFSDKLADLDEKHNNSNSKRDFYLNIRNKYNEMIINPNLFSDIDCAVLMVYINKHCFNGLYRVNSKGLFNVPFNNKETGSSFNKKNIMSISKFFKEHENSMRIMNGDFENAVSDAKSKDFVFFDSPYAPLKDTSFESYTKEGFSYEEHIRLANLFKLLSEKGVYCMLTNHNTKFINDLYSDFNIEIVPVKRFINANASKRIGEEVIITNY